MATMHGRSTILAHHRIGPSGRRSAYSTGLSARAAYTGLEPATSTTIATYADTTVNYGFDGDWGNAFSGRPTCSTSSRFKSAIARRAVSNCASPIMRSTGCRGWSACTRFELREDLHDTSAGVYVDPFDSTQNSTSLSVVSSQYRARTAPLYGQLDGDLGARRAGPWGCAASGAPVNTTTRRPIWTSRRRRIISIRRTICGAATSRWTPRSRRASICMRSSPAATRPAAST